MKGLYKVAFWFVSLSVTPPEEGEGFWNPLLQNEFEVDTNNIYDWQL